MKARTKSILNFSCFSFIVVVGLFLVIMSIALPPMIDKKLKFGISSQLVVNSENAVSYDSWVNNEATGSALTTMTFTYFNLTNPDDFLNGAKPSFVEVGPYVYEETKIRFDISFIDGGNQNSAKTWKYFNYRPDLSTGNPDTDLITTLNIPFQGVRATLGEDWTQLLALDMICSVTNCSMLVTRTPTELTWGYTDPTLEFLSTLQPGINPVFQIQINQTSQEESDNTTTYDVFYTGQNDINQIAEYVEWQGKTNLSIWGSDEANLIQGTDATQFSPNLQQSDQIIAFIDNAQRAGVLSCNDTVEVEGITLYRYVIRPDQLMNVTYNPGNAAYYMYAPNGVLNISIVSAGAPIFLSKPHFLDADPYYLECVEGLNPNRSLHDLNIDVEPITGKTLSAAKRLQINVKVDSLLLLYPNVTEVYFPVVWIDEGGSLTAQQAKEFKSSVYTAQKIKKYFPYAGYPSGILLVIIGISLMVFYAKKNQKKDSDYMLIQ